MNQQFYPATVSKGSESAHEDRLPAGSLHGDHALLDRHVASGNREDFVKAIEDCAQSTRPVRAGTTAGPPMWVAMGMRGARPLTPPVR